MGYCYGQVPEEGDLLPLFLFFCTFRGQSHTANSGQGGLLSCSDTQRCDKLRPESQPSSFPLPRSNGATGDAGDVNAISGIGFLLYYFDVGTEVGAGADHAAVVGVGWGEQSPRQGTAHRATEQHRQGHEGGGRMERW
jgi:hypothetical protein